MYYTEDVSFSNHLAKAASYDCRRFQVHWSAQSAADKSAARRKQAAIRGRRLFLWIPAFLA
jgi:hypothetical protein